MSSRKLNKQQLWLVLSYALYFHDERLLKFVNEELSSRNKKCK